MSSVECRRYFGVETGVQRGLIYLFYEMSYKQGCAKALVVLSCERLAITELTRH